MNADAEADGDRGDDAVKADVEAQKQPPRILEPVRTESGAFRALGWTVAGCLVVIAAVLVVRAL